MGFAINNFSGNVSPIALDLKRLLKRPEAINLRLRTREDPAERKLLLIRPDPANPALDQLFIDKLPVPREQWRFDDHDRVLSWRDGDGGGHLFLSHDGLGGHGALGGPLSPAAVQASATTSFLCDVAPDCGATYQVSGGAANAMLWDPASPAWEGAAWVQGRLRLTYTVTRPSPMGPGSTAFEFEDLQTQSLPWEPDPDSAIASVTLAQSGQRQVWAVSFKSQEDPDPDSGSGQPVGAKTVFPWWLQANEDVMQLSIDGAMQIDSSIQAPIAGIKGAQIEAVRSGYYRAAPGGAPVGVFDGLLEIGGQPLRTSRVAGRVLSWSGLSEDQQKRTGLPGEGKLRFAADGSSAFEVKGSLRLRRLGGAEAAEALIAHRELHPLLADRVEALRTSVAQGQPDIAGLLSMTPFVQDGQGNWSDAVQAGVMQDMTAIMNAAIPSDMWNLVYPNTSQPTLTGELAVVASSPVPGVEDPAAFYHQLGTAVMTQGLADGDDEACKYLNKPRAKAWLKTEVAASKVYFTHSQELFQYEWAQRFGLIETYRQDQVTNAGTYAPQIAARTQVVVTEINNSVTADPSDPDMVTKMIGQVEDAGNYATNNQLYWAFAYYTYNVSPGMLANIAAQLSQSGSPDGSMLSRLFEQNVSVLTALDSSGYFAKQYTLTINTFLTTNILTNMYGFDVDPDQFSLIQQYLQQFVQAHLNNPDPKVAAAVAQIQQILADKDADAILQASITALQGMADATNEFLALPRIAEQFVGWFKTNYPRFTAAADYFGSVMIGGLAAMATMNLILSFRDWSRMSDAEKADVVTNAIQLGVQFLSALVKRGVRIYKIFEVDGLTGSQRAASVFKIIANGEGGDLEAGLVRTGNSTARWLSSAKGTGEIDVSSDGVVNAILVNDADAAAEDAGLIGKLLGKNLDEFIATRIGPVFILAGIGFSIYSIAAGDRGLAMAGDLLGIIAGALSLFAMVGGWAIAGTALAEGTLGLLVSAAGPLSIVAALAGVGIMIYLMLEHKPPPDPIQEFVDNYATPAGFAVRNKNSSIDYAYVYERPEDGLLMIGASLAAPQGTLTCNAGGAIALGQPTSMPDTVWQAQTDGSGMTQFIAVAPLSPDAQAAPLALTLGEDGSFAWQPESDAGRSGRPLAVARAATATAPVALYLTLMDDGSVSFAAKMPPPTPPAPPPGQVRHSRLGAGTGPNAVTQTWLTAATADASLTSDGANLASLPVTVQPVMPDQNGNYAPSQAQGWLAVSGTSVVKTDQASTFTVTMEGMAPNYMAMTDLSFLSGTTPDQAQQFGPRFGVTPSTSGQAAAAIAFSVNGQLPPFLNFDPKSGTISPNGGVAQAAAATPLTMSAVNRFGSAAVDFSVVVKSPGTGGTRTSARTAAAARSAGNGPGNFEQLQMQFVNALTSAPSDAGAGQPMLPGLVDTLNGLPFYQAPDWTGRFRGTLAQVLALSLSNVQMVYFDTDNDFATYPQGYRDAFYSGVVASDTTNALIAMIAAAAPALNSGWWSNFAVVFLNDATRVHCSQSPPIHFDKLASDLAACNSQLLPGLAAAVTAVLQNGYPPTSDPLGLMLDHEAIAVQQLTQAIASGTFTANVNAAIQSGGDAATAATWFLYELWLLLALFQAANVDTLISQFETEGLLVPAEVGPGSWQTFSTWFATLSGSDVLPVAVPVFSADLNDVANPPYVVPCGYSFSLTVWGPLTKYWP